MNGTFQTFFHTSPELPMQKWHVFPSKFYKLLRNTNVPYVFVVVFNLCTRRRGKMMTLPKCNVAWCVGSYFVHVGFIRNLKAIVLLFGLYFAHIWTKLRLNGCLTGIVVEVK